VKHEKLIGRQRARRRLRVRNHLKKFSTRPRLSVFRSHKHIYAQVIDDAAGRTLASASTLEVALKGATGTKSEQANKVVALVADRARAAGIEKVVFDRAGFRYHGRIAALAEGAREAGLDF